MIATYMRLPWSWHFSQECFQRLRRVAGLLNFLVQILKLQMHASHDFLVFHQSFKQLLPVSNLTVFQHQLQSDVFKK